MSHFNLYPTTPAGPPGVIYHPSRSSARASRNVFYDGMTISVRKRNGKLRVTIVDTWKGKKP